MLDPDLAIDFLTFVRARHDVFEARQAGRPQPWTSEPIVATRKFTNVFRVLDFGSQFVLTDLLEPDLPPEEFVMRCFLYRHTGRVEAWQWLPLALGRYPLHGDLEAALEAFKEYRGDVKVKTFEEKSHSWTPHKIQRTKATSERPLFTGAYLVFPQSAVKGTDKIESIIALTQRLWDNGSFHEVVQAKTWEAKFGALRRNKGVADFMSMQTLTDYGYSTEFREDDFVIAGPGARKGAAALGLKPEAGIEWAVQAIRGLDNPPTVGGRLPSYMDAQNCLCEFSKWVRFAAKPVPDRLYTPAHPGPQNPPVLPEHWA